MRGGKREGAGRKSNPDKRILLSCRVSKDTLATVRKIAEEKGTGIGMVIDRAIEDFTHSIK